MTGAQKVLSANTATSLLGTSGRMREARRVTIQNSAAGALFLGGSDVSATVYGHSLAASAAITLALAPGDAIYGFSVAGATIGVLASP
jgi:hypothetical protein